MPRRISPNGAIAVRILRLKELINVIRNEGNEGARLPDIGAGIGAVHGEAAFENAHDGGTREWRVVLYRHA